MKSYVIITGGQLYNKGAESMTYITVDYLKRKFPHSEVVVLSNKDYMRNIEEKQNYNFTILPQSTEVFFPLSKGIFKFWGIIKKLKLTLAKKNNGKLERNQIREILKNTKAIVDISGYAFTSQMDPKNSLGFLSRIEVAKKHNIDMYIMPQSFGPFNFRGILGKIINYKAKYLLQYPKVIYAREKQGKDLLEEKYSIKENVKPSVDLVLLNKEFNKDLIFQKFKARRFENVNGVAIVPNVKTFKFGDEKDLLNIYKSAIEYLLSNDINVYIVRHSYEDIVACEKIKNLFPNINQVKLIGDDLSCVDFDNLVRQFDFIIGSRFHSIVHAYKNNIPVIAIGWAIKYHELLKTFDQENYIFDSRENISADKMVNVVKNLNENFNEESKIIKNKLRELQTHNPLDSVK